MYVHVQHAPINRWSGEMCMIYGRLKIEAGLIFLTSYVQTYGSPP